MLTEGLDRLISPRSMYSLGMLLYDTPISMSVESEDFYLICLVFLGGGVGVAQENPPSPTKKIAIRFFGSIPDFSRISFFSETHYPLFWTSTSDFSRGFLVTQNEFIIY